MGNKSTERENTMKTARNHIAAIFLTLIGISGSIILKSSNFISEPSFIILLFGCILVGLFIAYPDKVKMIDFRKGQLILKEIKETEISVKELGKAILAVVEASSHSIMLESYDEDAYNKSVKKLKMLIA
ncbi:MAG: hypothetical protein KAU60_16715 [Desulfobacterales bacterium]|nr:hypothetical protein [Desulfobacterales bacterium]